MSTSLNHTAWLKKTIGDLCTEDRRIVEPRSELAGKLPYLSLENVESETGRILLNHHTLNGGEGKSITFYFDERHVLYGKLRPYLNKVALPTFSGRCTTELIPLLPKASVCRSFLAAILRKPQVVEAAMQNKTGARMPRASMKHVMQIRILVPPTNEEQERVASELMTKLARAVDAKNASRQQSELVDALCRRLLSEFASEEGRQ